MKNTAISYKTHNVVDNNLNLKVKHNHKVTIINYILSK